MLSLRKPEIGPRLILAAVLLLLVLPLAASATTFYFQGIDGTASAITTGQNQFTVDITADAIPNYVYFHITNNPPSPLTFQDSSITAVYFWDGSIFTGEYSIDQSAGVNFIAGEVPVSGSFNSVANLPTASLAFSFDGFGTTHSTAPNGVDGPAEYLTLKLEVTPAGELSALNTVLAAMGLWGGSGTTWEENTMLAIGLKGQSFSDGSGAQFVDMPSGNLVIPVPPSVWLLGSGLVGLGLLGWRRRSRR